MPFWCGAMSGFWWILPLLGLVMMGLMFLACWRGVGCMGWRGGREGGEVAALRRELERLREDVGKLARDPG